MAQRHKGAGAQGTWKARHSLPSWTSAHSSKRLAVSGRRRLRSAKAISVISSTAFPSTNSSTPCPGGTTTRDSVPRNNASNSAARDEDCPSTSRSSASRWTIVETSGSSVIPAIDSSCVARSCMHFGNSSAVKWSQASGRCSNYSRSQSLRLLYKKLSVPSQDVRPC